jgi:putative nucleotidyltransferase with HDIG domain
MKTIVSDELVKKIPPAVFDIFDKFLKENKEIYLVGGAVRDLLLGKIPLDCDFTTNALPEEIQKILPDSFYDNIFGTVGLIIETDKVSEKYEITTFRGEQGYSDNRRPDNVWWGKSLEDDLKRRDFTINAMALRYAQGKLELIDLYEGQKDLENKLIRAVGNPIERFSEDALRMLRTIRFSSQLGFLIEENTFSAIKEKSKLLENISKERIKDELFKILKSNYPTEGIVLLYNCRLLDYIIPELIKGYGLKQAKHHIYDVWNHSLMSLKNCPSKDPLVRLAALIHDIGKPIVARGEGENRTFYNHEVIGASIARNLAKRLKFSKKESERLITLVRWHQFTVDERQTDSAIRRFIRNVGKENISDMLDVRTGDRLGGGAKETSWRLEEYKKRIAEVQVQPFSVNDLKVNGNDVMEILKIKPGPKIGEILSELFNEVENQKLENEREALLKKIKKIV